MTTKIEWTRNSDGTKGETWNPIAGCSKVSAGCANCYAIKDAHRLAKNPILKISSKYKGTTKRENGKTNWTGNINFSEDSLQIPLKNKKPTTYFVNSMSDLFHENVKDEWIDKVFAVMALCPQHTFQILTKRAERMKEYFNNSNFPFLDSLDEWWETSPSLAQRVQGWAAAYGGDVLDNVWLGVSVENQKAADERIPLLLETPAAIRFLSCEPLLEEIDLSKFLMYCTRHKIPENWVDCLCAAHDGTEWRMPDWVIVGGESGFTPRACSIDWIRSILKQTAAAGVPCFVKQLGKFPVMREEEWYERNPKSMLSATHKNKILDGYLPLLVTGKGEELEEMPEDLRVRQLPV